jgi:hypothetical protein
MPEHRTDYDDLIRHLLRQCWGLLADIGQHATASTVLGNYYVIYFNTYDTTILPLSLTHILYT